MSMDLSEQELRALVRSVVDRQAGSAPAAAPRAQPEARPAHPSHGLLALVGGGDAEGRCLIEPAVPCTHCGYCQSLGH
jgi:hypothetical protein